MTFEDFLSVIGGSERAFLSADELDRFVPTCCAMSNGAGGWVVLGASMKDDGLFTVTGVNDAASLENRLNVLLQDSRFGNASLVSYFRAISDAGKKVVAARVEPVGWRSRPMRAGENKLAYRRVEGENVVSGRGIRCRMALDALEVSRDDVSVPGLTMSDLDGESVASFQNKLVAGFPKWEALSLENFLKRALVLDECGRVTRAGQLVLGKNSNLVRLSLRDTKEIQAVSNLWSACEILLPRLSGGLTGPCSKALRECFVNAMLHAEHDAGVIDIEFGNGMAVFSNPGLPRSLKQGESEARNYRLMRIFVMAGLAQGTGRGFDVIREYDVNFRLFWNMLELATVSELLLSEGAEPPGEPEKPSVPGPGWLPVVQEKFMMLTPVKRLRIEELEFAETDFAEFEIPEASTLTLDSYGANKSEADDINDFNGAEISEEDEYLGTADDEDDVFSPLVKKVRNTPRMPPGVVRDAILELCAEYKSISELASALVRSENSLRRHYITYMVKKGLLEMEFPDKVGHPDQRYRFSS